MKGGLLLCALVGAAQADDFWNLRRGAQSVNFWKLAKNHRQTPFDYSAPQVVLTPEKKYKEFPVQAFPQLLDHWDEDSPSFLQRYWVNKRHYRPGGPVIVLDGGETSGIDRLPFLDTGIVDILAKATNGVGVVLEHRYYGESIPVKDLSTDSLRWLTNAQSLEDSAYFMKNLNLSSVGITDNVTAYNVPWVYYGGSYAGARAAHMRVLYPDIVFGAIASSAVTHATIDNWEYMDIIRTAAPKECSDRLVSSIARVDDLLAHNWFRRPLKRLFGLGGLTHDDDFVSTLSWPLGSFQNINWDEDVGDTGFEGFCAALAGYHTGSGGLMRWNADEMLLQPDEMDDLGGAKPTAFPLDFTLLNYAKYIREHVVVQCPSTSDQDDCFGTHNDQKYCDISLNENWRAWIFQVCTEWGYFIGAPPTTETPTIVSRLLTVQYEAKICKQAFPPGHHMHVPEQPNVTAVNVFGDYGLAADRLAFVDGSIDPWRPCTPHSRYAPPRDDTILRPFKLIPDGVHHHDQNGKSVHSWEPEQIQKIHTEEVKFVEEWLKDWKPRKP